MSIPLRRFTNDGYLPRAAEKEVQIATLKRSAMRHIGCAWVLGAVATCAVAVTLGITSNATPLSIALATAVVIAALSLYTSAIRKKIKHSARHLRIRISFGDVRIRTLHYELLRDPACQSSMSSDANRSIKLVRIMQLRAQLAKTAHSNHYIPTTAFKLWAPQFSEAVQQVIDTYLEDPRVIDVPTDIDRNIDEVAKAKILATLTNVAREYTHEITEIVQIEKWLKAEAAHIAALDQVIEIGKQHAINEANTKFNSNYMLKKYSP